LSTDTEKVWKIGDKEKMESGESPAFKRNFCTRLLGSGHYDEQ